MNVKNSTIYVSLSVTMLTVTALGIADIYMDLHEHVSAFHVFLELAIISLSLLPALYLLRRWNVVRRKALDAEQHLQDYLQGLGKQIEKEFQQWGLTDAEKKTALFILRGLSHKEIAAHCHRSEGTVRQHAVSVYRKAGLTSRAEFSAYFLQKLVAPLTSPVEEETEENVTGSAANVRETASNGHDISKKKLTSVATHPA